MPDGSRHKPAGDAGVTCDRCPVLATWSVQNLEGLDMQPITRWFACGRHVHAVLRDGQWETDAVQAMRLEEEANW